jgi:hypothetical protein
VPGLLWCDGELSNLVVTVCLESILSANSAVLGVFREVARIEGGEEKESLNGTVHFED